MHCLLDSLVASDSIAKNKNVAYTVGEQVLPLTLIVCHFYGYVLYTVLDKCKHKGILFFNDGGIRNMLVFHHAFRKLS